MRMLLLSRSKEIYTTRRLVEAAKKLGEEIRVLDPLGLQMHLDGKVADLYYKRRKLGQADVVIPRIAHSLNDFGLAVVKQLSLKGIPLLNSATAIAQSRNKMGCLQLLSANGVPIPATVMAQSASDLKEMVSLVGGVPVLVKLLQGGDRLGVMVCESLQSMESALEAILGLGHNLIVQQYVDTGGRDLRALVVGGQVVGAVQRTARVGRLSRTLGRGAKVEALVLPAEHERLAIRAAELVGLEVAAVDMLERDGKIRVYEVNSSPGLREMEAATGRDLASPIIARARSIARTAKGKASVSQGRKRSVA